MKMFDKKRLIIALICGLLTASAAVSVVWANAAKVEETTPLFTLYVTAQNTRPADLSASTIWKEDLAKIGINLEIVVEDSASISNRHWGADWYKTHEEGGWDLESPRMFYWIWDATSLLWWDSCYTAKGYVPFGWNYFGWHNAVADDLVREFFTTFNETARQNYMTEWQKIFIEDPPQIPCFNPYYVVLHNPELSGFKAWRVEGGPSFDATYELQYAGKTLDDDVTITWAVESDTGLLRGWNPFYTDGAPYRGCHHGLTTQIMTEKGYEVGPLLAESWEWSEDFMSMTFHLRDDVTWHDGTPFTAEDVVFSVDAALDPATGSVLTGDFGPVVDHAEALDDHTVVVYVKKPYPDLAGLMGTYHFYVVPKHILGDVPHSEWKTHATNTESGLLPGVGPYTTGEWVREDHWILEAYDDYFGGRHLIDRIVFKVIPDPSTALASLEAGEIDVIGVYMAGQLMSEFDRLESEGKIGMSVQPKPGFGFIGVNRQHPILQNRHVVRALWYALDLERIREEIYFGNGEIAYSAIHPLQPYHDASVKDLAPTYDLEAAKAELALAGYTWPHEVEVPETDIYVPAGGGFAGGFVVAAVIMYLVMGRRKE